MKELAKYAAPTLLLSAFTQLGAIADTSEKISPQTCTQLAATIGEQQAFLAKRIEGRDKLASLVELEGEAWEDAETMRRASPAHAQRADSARVSYDKAKRDLQNEEQGLQEFLQTLNTDISDYNQRCATD